MCTACAKKISGMKKRKATRRRSRVSGFSMGQAFSGLTNIKTLGTAAATVYGLKSVAEKATGTDLKVLRSKDGAMYEALAGTAGLFFLKNPILKGISLGVMVDGVKKWTSGEDWSGAPLPEKMDAVAGYSWLPSGGPSVRQPLGATRNGSVQYGR